MFQVNLKKGTITVPPDEPEVVQHICLAFVTATLYLLVQPRPPRVDEVIFFTSFKLMHYTDKLEKKYAATFLIGIGQKLRNLIA